MTVAKMRSLVDMLSSEEIKRQFEEACRREAEKPRTPVPENERMIWPVDDSDIPDGLVPMTFAEADAKIPKEYLDMSEKELVEFFERVASGEIDPFGNPIEPDKADEQADDEADKTKRKP